MNTLEEIRLCTHYEIGGKKVEQFPSSLPALEKAVPVYETMEGWRADLSECKKYSDLPSKAVAYIERLRKFCYNVPILIVSTGPDRKETIEVEPLK